MSETERLTEKEMKKIASLYDHALFLRKYELANKIDDKYRNTDVGPLLTVIRKDRGLQ